MPELCCMGKELMPSLDIAYCIFNNRVVTTAPIPIQSMYNVAAQVNRNHNNEITAERTPPRPLPQHTRWLAKPTQAN